MTVDVVVDAERELSHVTLGRAELEVVGARAGGDLPGRAREVVTKLSEPAEGLEVRARSGHVLMRLDVVGAGEAEATVAKRKVHTPVQAVSLDGVRAVRTVGVVVRPSAKLAVPTAGLAVERALGVTDRLKEGPVEAAADGQVVARVVVEDVAHRVATVTVRHGDHVRPLVVAAERTVDHEAMVAVARREARHKQTLPSRSKADVHELLLLFRDHQLTRGRGRDLTHTEVEGVTVAPLDPRLTRAIEVVRLVELRQSVVPVRELVLGHGLRDAVLVGETAVMTELKLHVPADVARGLARELQRGKGKREARRVTGEDAHVAELRGCIRRIVPSPAFPAGLKRGVDVEGEVPPTDVEAIVVPSATGATHKGSVLRVIREVAVYGC